MVSLRRMSQQEFEEYRAKAIVDLAEAEAEAFELSMEEAAAAAQRALASRLPDGSPERRDQYLHAIVEGEKRIGWLWFEARTTFPPRGAYLLDIVIEAPCRGRGYGTEAMQALEEEVRHLGLARVSLNVFARNEKAARFYEKLGYLVVSRIMMKTL